jgi:hypothetical protein
MFVKTGTQTGGGTGDANSGNSTTGNDNTGNNNADAGGAAGNDNSDPQTSLSEFKATILQVQYCN